MTIYEVLHPRNDVDRLYVSRKEGLACIDNSVDTLIRQLKDYIKIAKILITVTRNN